MTDKMTFRKSADASALRLHHIGRADVEQVERAAQQLHFAPGELRIGLGDFGHVAGEQLAPFDVEVAELRDGLRAVGLVAEFVEIFDDAVDAGFGNAEGVPADTPEGCHFAFADRSIGQYHTEQHQQLRRQHRIVRDLAHARIAVEDRAYLVQQSHRHQPLPIRSEGSAESDLRKRGANGEKDNRFRFEFASSPF